jgi:alkanesulfonate monooxygenase SsuD/methylene tetrahydromethanopterin reductase-like flavin-dependent oxidoreductase (luciferase family)
LLQVGVLHETPYSGVTDALEFPTPDRVFDPKLGRLLYQEYLEELVSAEKMGFDVVALPEQHSKQDNIDPSPNILVSYLVALTNRIRILPFGTILPLHNPLRIAEEYAMLDVISKGRISVGFVRGGPTNYLAYGLDYEKEKSRFEEAWDLIVRAWTEGEPFEWKSDHYKFNPVSIWPTPYQKPHPQIYTAGGGTIDIAAKRGAGIGLGFSSTNNEVSALVERYNLKFKEASGGQPKKEMICVARSIFVGESDAEAQEACEKHLLHQFRVLYPASILANMKLEKQLGTNLYWASRLFLTKESYDGIVKMGNHIAGSPETVVNTILEQQREFGFGIFFGLFRYGDMPHDKAMKSMRLFSEEVMPKIKGVE